jgi:midasin (ATPase involved in ribosome maturation)
MSKTNLVALNAKELKEFLNHIIENNRFLQEQNKTPVSIEVIGESGIGKTSAIIQLAKELDFNFVKLNLSQIEEIGDLVGFQFVNLKYKEMKKVKKFGLMKIS